MLATANGRSFAQAGRKPTATKISPQAGFALLADRHTLVERSTDHERQSHANIGHGELEAAGEGDLKGQ